MSRTRRRTTSVTLILVPLLATSSLAYGQAMSSQGTASDSVQRLGTVSIVATPSGRGETRGANAIGRSELHERAAGTSALKAVEKLPGVNVQSADPWGAYEWANRVTMRGFQTQQIGQTFDGLPLGDMSYGNFNGLGIGRAVDPDNMAGAEVAQGSGALGTASANNLGGVIQYLSDAPRVAAGLSLRQTVGSANTYRTSARWDTGLRSAGDKGMSAYLSFTRQDNDKWKGGGIPASPVNSGLLGRRGLFRDGQTWQEQLNAKSVAFVGAHKLTGYYAFSNRSEADYVDLSLARWNTSGRSWDQFTDWAMAKQFATTSGQEDEAYWQSSLGARRDHLAYLLAELAVADGTTVTIQPYLHRNKGNGDWTAPSYGAAWSPDPLYFRQTQYADLRYGTNAKVSTTIAGNDFEAGLWYESNSTHIRRPAWRLVSYQNGPEVNFGNVIRLNFDRTGDITTTVAYVQNTNHLLENRLKVTYGGKFLNVDANFHSNGNTLNAPSFGDADRPDFDVQARGNFLPQAGAVLAINASEQLFANYSENINQYPLSPQSGIYNLSPAGFAFFKANVKPERASTMDFGVRTKRERVEASLSSYYVKYRNRLVGLANCQLTAFCASVFANVGTVTTTGLEGLLALRLTPRLSWNSSAAFNSSRIDDDYSTGTSTGQTVIKVKGKDPVDAPRFLANSGLRYDDRRWTGNVGVRHVDKRYFTILNDLSVPAYTVADAGVGMRFPSLGRVKEPNVQLNVTNLFDASYIGPVGTGGFTVSGDNQTLQAGARRLLFLTLGTTF
ncbi:MAG: TonB-dependent receptor [Gemmatimonadaceae bacterium]